MITTEISFSGVLAIVAYFQFLLIWAQAEIGLKQHSLFASQFDPVFKLQVNYSAKGDVVTHLHIHLKNTSDNPAYNMFVSRIFNLNLDQPINPKYWKEKIDDTSSKDLGAGDYYNCTINDVQFAEDKGIEFTYTNKFGVFKDIFVKFGNKNALIIPPRIQEPGLLLNTFIEVRLFFQTLKYEWYLMNNNRG